MQLMYEQEKDDRSDISEQVVDNNITDMNTRSIPVRSGDKISDDLIKSVNINR